MSNSTQVLDSPVAITLCDKCRKVRVIVAVSHMAFGKPTDIETLRRFLLENDSLVVYRLSRERESHQIGSPTF